MTVYVAVASSAIGDAPTLPDPCVNALSLSGATAPEYHIVMGFACATAGTRPDGAQCYIAGGVIVAGDVRLDGRKDLARALSAADSRAGARAGALPAGYDDLALVHAAYAAWGDAAVERLRGDFSFVLWDGAGRRLLAARDGLGVRPLYYARIERGLCLSNCLDAVRAHPAVGGALRTAAVVSFLEHGWNRDSATTTFAGVARLPAATMLVHASGGDPEIATHWRMPDPAPLEYSRDDDYVDHYRALLDEAVRDRISGPTTLLLSGGLDSASIAATIARVAPRAGQFAVTMRSPDVESADESRLARAVAARTGVAHEVCESAIEPFVGKFPRTPEPYDDPELPANSRFFSAVARHAPVVLQGDDGDALFHPPGVASMIRRYGAFATARRVIAHTMRFGRHPYLGFWLARRLRIQRRPDIRQRPDWLRMEAGESPPEPPQQPNAARPDAARRLSSSIWQSVHQGTDRAFLGAPVEFRWPFLDTRLLEFVFAIPPIPWCQRKYLVRRAYAGELPAEVIARKKTTVPGYFEFAVAHWRGRTGGALPPLHERTAEFVDPTRLGETLRTGDTEAVLAGWRALQLDRWFRDQETA